MLVQYGLLVVYVQIGTPTIDIPPMPTMIPSSEPTHVTYTTTSNISYDSDTTAMTTLVERTISTTEDTKTGNGDNQGILSSFSADNPAS